MNYRLSLLSTTMIVSAFASGSTAIAADLAMAERLPVFTQLPAVDGLNGKVELFGQGVTQPRYNQPFGTLAAYPYSSTKRWRGSAGGAGAVSAPIGSNFGVQLEGLVTHLAGRPVAGLGGHFFWRDPSKGLLGVYTSGTYFGGIGGIGVARAAVEGEAYLGRFTIEGMVGAETGRKRFDTYGVTGVSLINVPFYGVNYYDMKTRFFDKFNISYYALDNLKLTVGQIYTGGKIMGTVGAEYLFPIAKGTAGALFANAHIGARGTADVRAGFKIYFGRSDKTLIRRHREDDPDINLPLDMLTLANTRNSTVVGVPVAAPVCKDFEGFIIPCGIIK